MDVLCGGVRAYTGARLQAIGTFSADGAGPPEKLLMLLVLEAGRKDAAVRQTGWFNHRIVVVTAASLLAGPGAPGCRGARKPPTTPNLLDQARRSR